MKQIFKSSEISDLVQSWKKLNNKIVLVGGCFDILHVGHVDFLEKAKEYGDKLVVLLESDENIKKNKGENRPVNRQNNRARLLSALRMVDAIIMLSEMKTDNDYEKIIKVIKPEIIAITEGDCQIKNKIRQAEVVGAKIVIVNQRIEQESSSKIIEYLSIKPGKIKNNL